MTYTSLNEDSVTNDFELDFSEELSLPSVKTFCHSVASVPTPKASRASHILLFVLWAQGWSSMICLWKGGMLGQMRSGEPFNDQQKALVWGGPSYYLVLEHNQQKAAFVSNSRESWLGFSPIWSTILATNYRGSVLLNKSLKSAFAGFIPKKPMWPGEAYLPAQALTGLRRSSAHCKPWHQPLGTPTYMLYAGSSRKHLG